MGIRSLCAAAVLAAGVGQAEAATMPPPYGTYEVEMTFFNADVICNLGCEDGEPEPTSYGGMTLGDTRQGTLTVGPGYDANYIVVDMSWAGGVLANSEVLDRIDNNSFANSYYYYIDFTFIDGLLTGMFTGVNYPDGKGNIEQLNDFEFVEVAPIPLPATAALLPIGIGALAFLRKRRRPLS